MLLVVDRPYKHSARVSMRQWRFMPSLRGTGEHLLKCSKLLLLTCDVSDVDDVDVFATRNARQTDTSRAASVTESARNVTLQAYTVN